MRFLRQSLMGLFLLSVTVGTLLYAGYMIKSAVEARMERQSIRPEGRERIFAVNVVRAVPGTVTPELTAYGEIRSRRTLDIRAATSGTVIALSPQFEEGGHVQAGDVLVQIDPADAQSALEKVQNDLLDAEAEVRDADRALILARDDLAAAEVQSDLRARAAARQDDLRKRGVGTEAAVEAADLAAASARQQVLSRRQALAQAEARVDQAATRLQRARIGLSEAKRRLRDTEIRAEFAGTLSEVAVIEGGLVTVNERLAKLIDPDALEVAFRLSTPQYARLLDESGALKPVTVLVTLDVLGLDLAANGTVTRDSASVGQGQSGRQLFAHLDQSRGLKPGDYVTVRVAEPPLDNVVQLPAAALNAANEVLVLGEGDRLEALPVSLLRRQGDDVLVRATGLAGREVVTRRTPLLGAGIRVKPLRPDDGTAPEAPATLELSEERRAKLVAFVEANDRIPDEAKQRILGQLAQPRVPAQMVERIEARMGG
ncbi:efflux RND transporter periplasmic adaptor subunit [Shimia biformata]|uniref:efflux RND transporter periplasmic adaptor subunit n=1 Tax=Shimia biformata TaxID=1294299 RepID=UPI00194FBDB1|nr:HlyD family efflux transporter periplasmic adaptor subunit [Shimia biformata]